jgi:hypothetical protein
LFFKKSRQIETHRDIQSMSLTPQQIRSAELLAKGHSQEAVGNIVGVSRRTVARWLKREDFRNLSFGLLGRAAQSPQPSPNPSPESRKQSNVLTPQDLVGDALEAVQVSFKILIRVMPIA